MPGARPIALAITLRIGPASQKARHPGLSSEGFSSAPSWRGEWVSSHVWIPRVRDRSLPEFPVAPLRSGPAFPGAAASMEADSSKEKGCNGTA